MRDFFDELGREVRGRWVAANFDPARFARIAEGVLSERMVAVDMPVAEVVREFLLVDEQPVQSHSGFGQPELIVYDDPRFYIQVLFWLEGTTDIHQHEFSGAFHVLAGSSLHARFVFEETQTVSAHLRVGKLRRTSLELLETGRTVPIHAGGEYIHSLFHLETPSLTVVVRTRSDAASGPQFTYLPPHLAVDPFNHDALTLRRKQLLDVLEQTNDPTYVPLIREMIAGLDFERGFFILQNAFGCLRERDEWEETLALFERKHGALAKGVAKTLEEIARRDGLAAWRSEVTDVEHRFFLALLLNGLTRAELLETVGQRYPGAPTDTVLRWVEEMFTVSDFGASILEAEFPPELGVPVEEQAAAFLRVLRDELAGGINPPTHATALRAVLAASSLRPLVGAGERA